MTDNDVTLTDTDSEVADQVDSSSLEAAVDNALAAGVGGGGTIGLGATNALNVNQARRAGWLPLQIWPRF